MEIKAEVNGTPLPQRNAGANAKGAAVGASAAKGGNAIEKKPFVAGGAKGGQGQNVNNRQSRGGRGVGGFGNNRFGGNQGQNQGGQNQTQAAKGNQGGQSAAASGVSHNSSGGGGSGGGNNRDNRQSNAFFQRRNQNQSQNDVSVPPFCKKKRTKVCGIFSLSCIFKNWIFVGDCDPKG